MQGFALIIVLGSALVLQANAQSDPVCSSCPSKNCTYEKMLNCRCVGTNRTIEIINRGGVEYTNVSLGFAIDNTGSMDTEISSIKGNIENVVLATSGLFNKYVIGTFNDPYVSAVIESTDVTAINGFVDSIAAGGGEDCPEMALSGIQDVATRLTPGSVLFVFTDASAKDLSLEPTVLALLQSKDIRLNVIVTGDLCSGLGAEFTRLTSATNGTIYKAVKSDVDYVMNYIKNFAKFGINFIRNMPTSLDDLKAIAGGTCSCDTTISKLECIAQPCPQGFSHVEVKRRKCSPKPCVPKLVTLGFVIDRTKSMRDEISAIKAAISGILTANTVFKHFVVATFGDPYVKNVIQSTQATVIEEFITKITASSGGDCPNFALSGIEDAAKLARDDSVLILLTDAAAKDASKLNAVQALLLAKKIKLVVIITGTLCAPAVYHEEFHSLATATGGAVITLTSKPSVKTVLEFVRLVAAGRVPITSLPASLSALKLFKPLSASNCWDEIISTCICKC